MALSDMSQVQVLNKILQTKDFSLVTMNNLNADYFCQHVREFNFIKNHYDKYGEIPDRQTFIDTFEEFAIFDVNEPDTYLLEKLTDDYNTVFVGKNYNQVRQLIENDKPDEAMALIKNIAEGLQHTSVMTCTDLMADTSRYENYLDRCLHREGSYIKTGFAELDALIGGIDVENENMVIAARTGIGKSWTLIAMAVAAVMEGKRVGFYSGEMTKDKVGYRFDTIMAHKAHILLSNSAITRGYSDFGTQAAYQQHIDNIKTGVYGKGKFIVLTPNDIAGPATVDALQAFIEREQIEILFVDQYSLLEDTSKARVEHERVANISKAIKKLQVLKRIPIISVSQMNRTKNEDGKQDTTQIAMSDRIAQDATVIIMLDRKNTSPNQDPTQEQLILNVVKARDGGEKSLTYHANFNIGEFKYYEPQDEAAAAQTRSDYGQADSEDYDDMF